ncbi:MAG: hypothetical protein J7L95_01175 [Prolixibacteraceae bacterium]|nr:hypothetical protein [Prolixibacteraceae bacterium]
MGEHIRNFQLLGKTNGQWKLITKGESVGHKRIEKVNGEFDAIKLEITENVGNVMLKNFACY